MEKEYYVYEWIRLDTNEPFYVGKGRGKRCYELNRSRNHHFNNIVKSIPVAVNILEDNIDEKKAFEYEVFYINEYRELGFPLVNIADGGEGFSNPNRDYRGEKNPNFGNGDKIRGKNNPFYGKKHSERVVKVLREKALMRPKISEETRRKISDALKGDKNPFYGVCGKDNHFSVKVICIDDGRVFDSVGECSEHYGIDSSAVSRVCSNKYYHSHGLHFMYYDDYIKASKEEVDCRKSSGRVKTIYCITTNKFFENALSAAEYYNTDNSGIIKACKGKKRFSGKLSDGSNLVWIYYEEYVQASKSKIESLKKYIYENFVYCFNNQKIYMSCKEASVDLTLNEKKISQICKGKIESFKGYKFIYYNDFLNKKEC